MFSRPATPFYLHFQTKNIWDNRMKEAVVAWNDFKNFMLLTLHKAEMSNPQNWVWQEIKPPTGSCADALMATQGSLWHQPWPGCLCWKPALGKAPVAPLQHKQGALSCDSPPSSQQGSRAWCGCTDCPCCLPRAVKGPVWLDKAGSSKGQLCSALGRAQIPMAGFF